jgi:hypothetical protein
VSDTEHKHQPIASVPIFKAAPNVMFLRSDGGKGNLPDGRKFDIGSTCGLGGVDLVLCVYSADGRSGTHAADGGTYIVDGREMIGALFERGLLAPGVSVENAESDRDRLAAISDALGVLESAVTDMRNEIDLRGGPSWAAGVDEAAERIAAVIASARARADVRAK